MTFGLVGSVGLAITRPSTTDQSVAPYVVTRMSIPAFLSLCCYAA
jgi:hypothetical protein